MMATALGLTYLGVVLCYAASPSAACVGGGPLPDTLPRRLVRMGGWAVLGLGLSLSVAGGPVAEGVLVWLSMGMLACTLVVIAAPLVARFVPVTGAIALAVAVFAPWV